MKPKFEETLEKNEKEGMFAYKTLFYEEPDEWEENHWSKRLGGCIMDSIVNKGKYRLKYTATTGTDVYHDAEGVLFFKFHGAPDLVILRQLDDDASIPIITEITPSSPPGGETSESSQGSDIMAIEDAIGIKGKSKENPKVLEKVGELVSNMYVLLVKKGLKRLRHPPLDLPASYNLTMQGAVISRGVGTGTCIYEMPFLTIESDSVLAKQELAKLHVGTFLNAPRLDFICALFQHLIPDA